jgi:hypothetical protein
MKLLVCSLSKTKEVKHILRGAIVWAPHQVVLFTFHQLA